MAWVPILDEPVCIWHSTNTLGKDTNSAIGKIVRQIGFLNLGKAWSKRTKTILNRCRPGEGWAQPGYSYQRHAPWTALWLPN